MNNCILARKVLDAVIKQFKENMRNESNCGNMDK